MASEDSLKTPSVAGNETTKAVPAKAGNKKVLAKGGKKKAVVDEESTTLSEQSSGKEAKKKVHPIEFMVPKDTAKDPSAVQAGEWTKKVCALKPSSTVRREH